MGRAQPSIMNSQRRLTCCLLGHALKLGTGQIYNNVTKIQHISVSVGLIPAHTGNALYRVVLLVPSSAHPRAYGERNYERQTVTPHAWLIPVYTGNTEIPSPPCHGHAAHPRVYREYPGFQFVPCCYAGSSPCIQGIPRTRRRTQRHRRLIPVYTGNTRAAPARMLKASAHPRVYREYT